MEELQKQAQNLRKQITQAAERLKLSELESELADLQVQMDKPDFWQDSQKAQPVIKREADLSRRVQPWLDLRKSTDELIELINLKDPKTQKELQDQLSAISQQLSTLKSDLRFRGPFDDHDVILSIYAGAGGTDAQDWAQMLLRMYARWAEKNQLHLKTIEQSAGGENRSKKHTHSPYPRGAFFFPT